MENSAPIVPEAPCRLWLPGLGVTDLRVRRVVNAVKQYDADLNLARHEITGDWVVVVGEDGFPVYGFGKELPDPDSVERILSQHDMKRHSKKILADLARDAEIRRKDEQYRASENEGVVAQEMADFYSKHGARKATRIFVPRGF